MIEPLPKRPQQVLEVNNQFNFNENSEADYSVMSVPFVPVNPKENDWAYNNFVMWRDSRNRAYPDNQCPEYLIDKPPWDVTAQGYWLA